jgi:hypothetical protein
MTDMAALAKLLAQHSGTARPITRERGFPVSAKPLVLLPIVMAGESPALFGLGVGDGRGTVKVFVCANPVNRNEQYDMLADALKAVAPTLNGWATPHGAAPQIVVTGADSGRLVLGLIDRTTYAQRPTLSAVGRRLAWFDKRSDSPDSACLLVLPKALAACLATGQDEFADQHLGAFLEWCAPPDGKIWERVAQAELRPASGATSPDFDRKLLEPAYDVYVAATRDGDTAAAARAKQKIERLIGDEIRRRYGLAQQALRELVRFRESALAKEIAEEDRRGFAAHLAYVANPNNHLRRGFDQNMQTSEFVSREFAVTRVEGLSMRTVSGAYAKAKLSGDLLEGDVIKSARNKNGRTTTARQTVATTQLQLSLRAGDKLTLLADERFVFRVESVGACPQTGRALVRLEVTNGKTLPGLPALGAAVALAPALRDRRSLARAGNIAWQRMRALPTPSVAPPAPSISRDWASLVNALRGQK